MIEHDEYVGQILDKLDQVCISDNTIVVYSTDNGYDHPFADGNGRTARALFYWCMAQRGYWLIEFVSISRVIKKAPAQYVRAYGPRSLLAIDQMTLMSSCWFTFRLFAPCKLGRIRGPARIPDSAIMPPAHKNSHATFRQRCRV